MSGTEDVRAENVRLHQEIRGLNGQLEGLMRAMAGLRARPAEVSRDSDVQAPVTPPVDYIPGAVRCPCGAAGDDPASAHNRGCERRGDYPMDKHGRPLRWRERLRLTGLIHEFWVALSMIGMRDRLRCPQCKAVGTWKPHGGLWNKYRHKDRAQRRWMCKYCGRYEGKDIGLAYVYPCPDRGCWAAFYPWDPESPREGGPTPADVVWRHLGKTWPWYG